MSGWHARPVLFVENVERAIAFYTGELGFVESSRYEDDGRVVVGTIRRGGCAILLYCEQPEKSGRGRVSISLEEEPFLALRAEFGRRGLPVTDGWWGYETMIVEDPDGNELFFLKPNDAEEEGGIAGGR